MKTEANAAAAIRNHFNKNERTVETTKISFETSPDPVKKGQKWWCSDERKIIETTFHDEIRSGNISYQKVKESCGSINVNASPQQVCQKLRNM